MHGSRSGPLEKTAALLERAYRMALALQGRICAGDVEAEYVQAGTFEEFAIANELVAILDEAPSRCLRKQVERPVPRNEASTSSWPGA